MRLNNQGIGKDMEEGSKGKQVYGAFEDPAVFLVKSL
jgi:hypothetical protein